MTTEVQRQTKNIQCPFQLTYTQTAFASNACNIASKHFDSAR